jgi:hypothetical protein
MGTMLGLETWTVRMIDVEDWNVELEGCEVD